ncbi:nucleotidyltransferase family protein [Megasphaera hexanoica]|uniref:tRNA(Met) cytidine acetate ligase n=1 Tax=Megasphaera hexanoica TaxID=1675036 RepID=A0A848BS58_9FIRM|nr:nucleotidyltransferase family protein [Megasphaera hexanoica]NME28522.1 nucleotidyltransferase family protein [Megasphaera hexanoica]
MKRIAVIAEFNPFHTGHAWLLSQVRQQAGPQSLIVVIMSGSFVQRGEPALFDKWHRAAWAVEGGADLVFELPAVYSLSSADGFALGGVWLASRLGCSHLACGVERGTADDFYALARAAQDIRPCRGRETAGRRQTIALATRIPEQTASLLDQPNALLAASYVKAIVQQDLSLQFWPILRQGSHHDPSLAHSFASASALRQDIIQTGRCQHLHRYLTPQAREDMAALLSQGAYTDYDRYGDFILFQNRLLTPEMLRQLPAFNEGLENRWHRCMQDSVTYKEALAAIKTRRYAYSRLCRMGAYTLLSPGRSLMDQSYQLGPQYARLLALSQKVSPYIKEIKKELPVITRITAADSLSPLGRKQLALDLRCTDMQYYCFHGTQARLSRQDYYQSPRIR